MIPMVSSDTRCKGVHVKLDRETHASFKMKLIPHGVSMQQAFEEFARLVGAGSASAHRMLETMVKTRIKQELATVGLRPGTRTRNTRYVNELDSEKLYDLINEEEADEVEVPPQS